MHEHDALVLFNKIAMTFLAVLTVGMLTTGAAAVETFYTQMDDSKIFNQIVVGPDAASVGVQAGPADVATIREYQVKVLDNKYFAL